MVDEILGNNCGGVVEIAKNIFFNEEEISSFEDGTKSFTGKCRLIQAPRISNA